MGPRLICETDVGDADRQRERVAHLTVLHPAGAVGRVTLVARLGEEQRVHPGDWATSEASRASYVSLNRHGARRRADGLVAINAGLWADVDVDLSGEADPRAAATAMCAELRRRLAEASIPAPSYCLFSGRGIWLVWLLDRPLPATASERVRRLLRHFWGPIRDDAGDPSYDRATLANPRLLENARRMHDVWAGMPLDRSVSDLQRIHRVAGSVNPRSGLHVSLVWPPTWADVRRHRFDALADAVHPYSGSELDAFRQRMQVDTEPEAREAAGPLQQRGLVAPEPGEDRPGEAGHRPNA